MRTRFLKFLKWFLIVSATSFLLFLLLNRLFPLHDEIQYSTIMLDSKGEVIHAFLTPDQKWRMKTELSDISPVLKKTLIYKED